MRMYVVVFSLALFFAALPEAAMAQVERMYFPAVDDVRSVLVKHINAENVRIDMSAWYLTDGEVVTALLKRHNEGLKIRLIGDRGSIFEIDQHTKNAFYKLADAGVPIRLRYHPTWYPEIAHWKATIFAGQNVVTFGSANYTPFELAPHSSTNYKDETVLFTDDPALVGAFKTKFDVIWNDRTRETESQIPTPPYLLNWHDACARESACADFDALHPSPKPMIIDRARLEPDNPLPAEMNWGQGPGFNQRLVDEINKETAGIGFVVYRLTVNGITEALLSKHRSGVPIRIIIEPTEYRNRKWPEFWLTHAYIDKLWAAGVQIKKRAHTGLTHMKMLVTSSIATNASSNFAAAWQRDHNYFVPALTKPHLYAAMRDRFVFMWSDPVGFADFVPEPADVPPLASPVHHSARVATTPRLVWHRAAFATSYDVYLGTSDATMVKVANVPAVLDNDPPLTYSYTPSTALQAQTTYYWRVEARTFASDLDPKTIAKSERWVFTTGGSTNPAATAPAVPGSPNPADGAVAVDTSPTLSWSSNATTYNVAFGTSNPPPGVVSGRTTASYTPGTLTESTTYYWQITAVNSSGSTTGPVWSFTTRTTSRSRAPGAPRLVASYDGMRVNLSWTPSEFGNDAVTYLVEAGTAPGASNLYAVNVGSITSWAAPLGPGLYYFRIRAANAVGTSLPSNEETIAVGGGPGRPSFRDATESGGILTLSWLAGVGASATAHRLDFYYGSTLLTSVMVGPSTTTSLAIPAGTQATISVQVTAFNGDVAGPASTPFSFTIGAGCSALPPPQISGAVVAGTASVNWPAIPGATAYILSAGTNRGGTQYVMPTNLGVNTGASASGLPVGFSAWVRVIAVNACGSHGVPTDFFVR